MQEPTIDNYVHLDNNNKKYNMLIYICVHVFTVNES